MLRLRLTLLASLLLLGGCDCASQIDLDGGADAGRDAGPGQLPDAGSSDGGASAGCGLVTCQWANADCGPLGDGCGGVLDCGACVAPQTCGGGGVPSRCGGSAACVPRTCVEAGASCGPLGDGCGGLLQCGDCVAPETCGGGGQPSRCGQSGPGRLDGGCTPTSCAARDAGCGAIADGCGGALDCGGCGSGGVCGAVEPNRCAPASLCRPTTCAAAGATCGLIGDGCGALVPSCGGCDGGLLCGAGGVLNRCGTDVPDAGACTGLCLRQARCDASTTTVTGVVVAPTDPDAGYGQPDPVPGVLVYVPNGPVLPLTQGVSCSRCAGQASGSPLVKATTGTDGTFTLTQVPCGADVPLVIQLGKWRRQVVIPQVACCQGTALPTELTRLPRNPSEGDLPLIAVATGSADPIECVLPKLGIDSSAYSLPGGQGRVRFYVDNGVDFDGGAPGAATLWDTPGALAQYDLVISDCVGSEVLQAPSRLDAMRAYLDSGGRLYASHFSYAWLFQNPPFSTAASWQVDPNTVNRVDPPDQRAAIDVSFPKGVTFSDWMALVGGSPAGSPGQVDVQTLRRDTTGVLGATQKWISGYRRIPPRPGDAPYPLQFTFNTPVGTAPELQCGRVLFSDFHVATGGTGVGVFPDACGPHAPMSPQEKVLEFMLLDLTSCIQPDVPPVPSCRPRSCAELALTCGLQGDGCGGSQDCGPCPAGTFCGSGGTPGVCGVARCTPRTCADQGVQCGPTGDGCGALLQCPVCPGTLVCGAGGPGRCGPACVPRSCGQLGVSCGPAGDGCGGTLACGACTAPDTCGGGGMPGACGHPACTPRTCRSAGADCGVLADGCGGSLQCGTCLFPATCGGAGIPNVCGALG